MSAPIVLAEFRDPDTLVEAARRARAAGLKGLDAHTPFAVEGLSDALALEAPRLRPAMVCAAALGAGFVYLMCWYSGVIDYPLNLGARPLHAWPVFLVLAFEAGILAATFTGIAGFFIGTGLPRLNHPVFAGRDFDRASQDRFSLTVSDEAADAERLAALLDGLGPVSVRALQP